ncbi:hypothetical protein [Sphingosinicella sp. YJ22]|uniref:hypothetical protein n=1 Tax=Sphingosinicella sp. YJ22 TaxID=1104780 RepID=UPI00140DBD43|nr:hypothetical protein [Sphingosinicella sp. YJ22]
MHSGRTEELIVGLLCLVVILPWIAWTVRRGLASGRMPIGRGKVERDERPGAFRVLLGLYILAAAMIAFAGLDLLLQIWR